LSSPSIKPVNCSYLYIATPFKNVPTKFNTPTTIRRGEYLRYNETLIFRSNVVRELRFELFCQYFLRRPSLQTGMGSAIISPCPRSDGDTCKTRPYVFSDSLFFFTRPYTGRRSETRPRLVVYYDCLKVSRCPTAGIRKQIFFYVRT